jgi:hypothetical protein
MSALHAALTQQSNGGAELAPAVSPFTGKALPALWLEGFYWATCQALQSLDRPEHFDCFVKVLDSVDLEGLLYYAAVIEPGLWEYAGFDRYAERLDFVKPTAQGAPA